MRRAKITLAVLAGAAFLYGYGFLICFISPSCRAGIVSTPESVYQQFPQRQRERHDSLNAAVKAAWEARQ